MGNQDYPVHFKKTGKDTWTATDTALCKQSMIVLKRDGSLWTYDRTAVKINDEGICKGLDSKPISTTWSWDGSKTFLGGCKYIEIN